MYLPENSVQQELSINYPSTMLEIIPFLYMKRPPPSPLAVDLEDIFVSYHSHLISLLVYQQILEDAFEDGVPFLEVFCVLSVCLS